jgi:Transposase DDE domain
MGELTGANPVDRGKLGSNYHLLIDGRGIPLAVGLAAANTHDSLLLEQLVDAVPPVKGPRGRPGRPRRRPAKLHADKGYDYRRCRQVLRQRRISPRIARRGSSPQSGWAGIAGGSSAALPGWSTFGTCRSAMAAAPTISRPSSI